MEGNKIAVMACVAMLLVGYMSNYEIIDYKKSSFYSDDLAKKRR